MKILVLNGSPKGEYSITLYTSLYLSKMHPEHEFTYLSVGQKIRAFEKDFSEAKAEIEKAELLIFSYPVYTFLVPSQLHRFVELMKENGVDLSEKYVTQITTSKHFYDVTAHRFIEDNVYDMQGKYIRGLSADMEDLTKEKGQKEALSFFDYVLYCAENGLYEPLPMKAGIPAHRPVSLPEGSVNREKRRVAVVADLSPEDQQLKNMILHFEAVLPYETELVNIHDFPFRGGCLSCFNCASDGTCIYQDGFSELLREKIQMSDAIVLAFSIKDHSMGSIFKTYDDRQFCNGHRTVTMGLPFGYLVSGDLSKEENLRLVIEGRAEVGGNFLAGTASDEFDPDGEIDAMAKRLSYAIENHYVQPSNFLGVGGMKIFRDLIWQMQGLMKADHRFYKAHNQYDFPQKQRLKMWAMYLVGGMMSNPKIKKKIGSQMNEGMIMPYKKVLENVDKKREE